MFKLTPELAQKSFNNDPFWAVRCGNGMMVISGTAGSMEVPSEGIRLGQRFFNTPQNVIVREGEMDAYRESRRLALIESAKPAKASSAKIISYSQLNKKKNQRKRK